RMGPATARHQRRRSPAADAAGAMRALHVAAGGAGQRFETVGVVQSGRATAKAGEGTPRAEEGQMEKARTGGCGPKTGGVDAPAVGGGRGLRSAVSSQSHGAGDPQGSPKSRRLETRV